MLDGPMAYTDLADGESVAFRVLDWELGESTVRPRDWPEGKVVPTVRVHVPAEDKPAFPHYWDFTAARLIAQLKPQLGRGDVRTLRFTVTARGLGMKRSYQLDVRRAAEAAGSTS